MSSAADDLSAAILRFLLTGQGRDEAVRAALALPTSSASCDPRKEEAR